MSSFSPPPCRTLRHSRSEPSGLHPPDGVHRLPDIAHDCVSSVRVEVAANQAAAKPNSRLVSAGSKLPKSITPPGRPTFSTASVNSVVGSIRQRLPLLPRTPTFACAAISNETGQSRPMHRSKRHLYSITSSALVSNVGGTVKPSALAVLRLITRSNFVGCSTGRSAGLAPLRIFPMYTPAWR